MTGDAYQESGLARCCWSGDNCELPLGELHSDIFQLKPGLFGARFQQGCLREVTAMSTGCFHIAILPTVLSLPIVILICCGIVRGVGVSTRWNLVPLEVGVVKSKASILFFSEVGIEHLTFQRRNLTVDFFLIQIDGDSFQGNASLTFQVWLLESNSTSENSSTDTPAATGLSTLG